ncbi:MAG: hypothetical protein BMS9Abin31_1256 [Gammaproteobacteria bacterium]|nr:MAG: hypothetical protein BMS9Abin31_1256 [Gammaproteobacteria bacterium]
MSANTNVIESYRNSFLKEVEANVEEGEWVKMCMQCGVCAGSCPLGPHWEHSPQKLFMMIRAGKREEVLTSESMWMCTSCYNCVVRCPRGLPITHIMHGLAHYAKRLGMVPKNQQTAKFGQIFWDNLIKTGRVNELKMGVKIYFMNSIAEGIKLSMSMIGTSIGLYKAKRLSPMEMLGGGHKCKGAGDLQKILKKAAEIETAKIKKFDV